MFDPRSSCHLREERDRYGAEWLNRWLPARAVGCKVQRPMEWTPCHTHAVQTLAMGLQVKMIQARDCARRSV